MCVCISEFLDLVNTSFLFLFPLILGKIYVFWLYTSTSLCHVQKPLFSLLLCLLTGSRGVSQEHPRGLEAALSPHPHRLLRPPPGYSRLGFTSSSSTFLVVPSLSRCVVHWCPREARQSVMILERIYPTLVPVACDSFSTTFAVGRGRRSVRVSVVGRPHAPCVPVFSSVALQHTWN